MYRNAVMYRVPQSSGVLLRIAPSLIADRCSLLAVLSLALRLDEVLHSMVRGYLEGL